MPKGKGRRPDSSGRSFDKCPSCHGSGLKKHYVTRDGVRKEITAKCSTCGGTGRRKS